MSYNIKVESLSIGPGGQYHKDPITDPCDATAISIDGISIQKLIHGFCRRCPTRPEDHTYPKTIEQNSGKIIVCQAESCHMACITRRFTSSK